MGRVGKSVLQKTFPPFPNASATLTQQHFQNGIGLHSGGHDDARRKGRHTGPDAADVIANHDETASELPGGHRNAAPPGHAGGGNHTMPGQQQCFDETLFHFGIIHGLDDDVASGKQSAGRRAIKSPLLDSTISGAKGVLLNITGGPNLSLIDVNEASKIITDAVDPDATIIFGASIDENMGDTIRVTVIATGIDDTNGGSIKAPKPAPFTKPETPQSRFTKAAEKEAAGKVGSFGAPSSEIPPWIRNK